MAPKGLTDLKLDSRVQAALEAVRDRLTARHPVDRIVLYGSVAWGRPDDESDVDLLIVLKDPPDHDIEDQISRVIFEINLEYDTNLSELTSIGTHGSVACFPECRFMRRSRTAAFVYEHRIPQGAGYSLLVGQSRGKSARG